MDEKEITSEQLDKFIEFAFEKFKKEEDTGDYSKQKIKNLFTLPTVQFRNIKNAKVRQGTRNFFVDFPCVAFHAINGLYRICNERAKYLHIGTKSMEKDCKRFIEEIRREKKNKKSKIGKLSNSLLNLGINWIIWQQLIIRYEVEEYYQTFWKDEILQLIDEWKTGNDSLLCIYKKIYALTVKYEKIIDMKGRELPYLTKLLLEKNDYLSIEREMEKLENLFMKTNKYIEKNKEHPYYPSLSQITMDIKTSIHQIRHVLFSGYCFTSFILLRKLIESFGLLLFMHSIPYHFPEIEKKASAIETSEEKWIESIEKWVSSFKSNNEWSPISISRGIINSDSTLKNKGNEESGEQNKSRVTKIRNIETFKNTIRNRGKEYYILKHLVDVGGTFLTEQLDVIRTYGEDAYTYAESEEKILTEEKEIYGEYSKLSEMVHEPIYIDYPPFASFIEYLSFLHHLRKIRYLLQETFHIYTHLF